MTQAIATPPRNLRLMPWSNERGHAVYLSTGDGTGYLSRLADDIESTQLGMAEGLLEHVQDLLTEGKPTTSEELRFFAARLCDCLCRAVSIADSRGERLADAAAQGGADDGAGAGASANGRGAAPSKPAEARA